MSQPKTKLRIDSWAAVLTDAQRWNIYYRMQRGRWTEVCKWIEAELEIEPPSRTALYAFTARMRGQFQAKRIEDSIVAAAEAGDLARNAKQNDEDLIGAFKALAADTALRGGDQGAAREWMDMSLALADARIKALETDIRDRAQQTRDKQLKLAREKFEAAETRATTAEKRADAAEAVAATLQAKITLLEKALQDAGKTVAADPAAVAAEIDKVLGRVKKQA